MAQTHRKIRVVAAMLERDGRYLITQRRPTATLPLLWEFPGGKVEPGESDEAALARELREEMDIQVVVGERVVHVEHAYADYDVDFRVYRCTLTQGEIKHIGVHDHRWVLQSELDRYEFPAADEKTMRQLLAL
jgi:8-oxo-dGTP diphosphatase